jgi:DNA-directed RNA polymerase specialized sigma24 family protein
MDTTHQKSDLKILAERQQSIRELTEMVAIMQSHQTRWILFARESGCTWPEIAQALGVSPQAAQQRHARAVELLCDEHKPPAEG